MNTFLSILASLTQSAPAILQEGQASGLISPSSKVPNYVALGSLLVASIVAGIQASHAAKVVVPGPTGPQGVSA